MLAVLKVKVVESEGEVGLEAYMANKTWASHFQEIPPRVSPIVVVPSKAVGEEESSQIVAAAYAGAADAAAAIDGAGTGAKATRAFPPGHSSP